MRRFLAAYMRKNLCVCVCVCVRVRARARVCVCIFTVFSTISFHIYTYNFIIEYCVCFLNQNQVFKSIFMKKQHLYSSSTHYAMSLHFYKYPKY